MATKFKVSVWGCVSTRSVVYVEAGKAFVDLLLALIDLPTGSLYDIFRKSAAAAATAEEVEESEGVSLSISNIYDSFYALEDNVFQPSKKERLKLRLRGGATIASLPLFSNEIYAGRRNGYVYACCTYRETCKYVSFQPDFVCPVHNGSSKEGKSLLEETLRGYVVEGTAFLITDELRVVKSSTASTRCIFKEAKVMDMEDVDVLEVSVGEEEILKIFKLSLTQSNGVLNAVFGPKFGEYVRERNKSEVV